MGSCWRPQASARAWKAEPGPCCPWRSIRIRAAGTFTLWGFSLPFLRGWGWQNATWVLFPGGLQTLLSACVHVCSTPGMLKWKARHAQNNICFHTKTTLILFAFCFSGVLLLFSAFTRTWNMLLWAGRVWFEWGDEKGHSYFWRVWETSQHIVMLDDFCCWVWASHRLAEREPRAGEDFQGETAWFCDTISKVKKDAQKYPSPARKSHVKMYVSTYDGF